MFAVSTHLFPGICCRNALSMFGESDWNLAAESSGFRRLSGCSSGIRIAPPPPSPLPTRMNSFQQSFMTEPSPPPPPHPPPTPTAQAKFFLVPTKFNGGTIPPHPHPLPRPTEHRKLRCVHHPKEGKRCKYRGFRMSQKRRIADPGNTDCSTERASVGLCFLGFGRAFFWGLPGHFGGLWWALGRLG